jgi:23S rRNA (guanosine2251-2'-O)-methyltransferase
MKNWLIMYYYSIKRTMAPKVTMHKPPRFSVIIHDVRSILNVGSIFRTADAAGADMVYLTGYTPGPDTHPEKMAKTALGAENKVIWARARRVGDVIKKLRSQGVAIVALEQSSHSIDYRRFKSKFPLALLVGNEVTGIVNVMRHDFDATIEIPMRGAKESLNVAVAFGVAAYELTRRW